MGNTLTFAIPVTFVEMQCGECGVTFAMTETFRGERKRDHNTWYCPNGHARHYPNKSEVEILREQLAEKERQLAFERARAATNYAAREKAEKAERKLKKRVSAGVCPCCQRTVSQMARHIKTKHPEYVAEASK